MAPLLSIIIPAYNAEPFIAETIESALSQTLRDTEIIIVNDGSTDSTMQIIKEFGTASNVRIYDNVINRGANYTYNYGVLQALGAYVTFLDADDLFLPTYCERVIEKMRADNAQIGYANLFAMDGNVKLHTTLYGTPRDPRFAGLLGGAQGGFPYDDMETFRKWVINGIHISPRAIYEKSLFIDYGLEDSRLRITHDWLRHIKFMLNGAKCTFVATPLGYYRIHANGNSQRDPEATLVENIKLFEIVVRECSHLMTNEERLLASRLQTDFRMQLFTALANSTLTNAQIVQYLMERRLHV